MSMTITFPDEYEIDFDTWLEQQQYDDEQEYDERYVAGEYCELCHGKYGRQCGEPVAYGYWFICTGCLAIIEWNMLREDVPEYVG